MNRSFLYAILILLVFSLGLFYGMLFAWRQMRSDGTRGDLYRAALAVDGRFGDGRFATDLAEAMTNERGTVFVVRLGEVPDAPSSTVRVIGLALCGVRSSPRVGLAFAGLALSGCSSTVFDWPTLFDFAERGGLGMENWALSWMMFALFLGLGARLAAGTMRRPRSARPAFASAALAGLGVLGLRLVPPGDAPRVRDGYAAGGAAPRTLALHDASWSLREVCARAGRDVLVPVRPVARIDPEYANPLYTPAMAALWKGE